MRKLSRKIGARSSLEKNLLTSLVVHGRIMTTEAKAKHLVPIAERLITRAKADTLAARRHAATLLNTKLAVAHLFNVLIPALPDITSGHVSIIKTTPRFGDGSNMAVVKIAQKKEPTTTKTPKK